MTWHVEVDAKRCNGCGECVESCPGEVYDLVEAAAVPARLDGCHGCHTCEAVCPEDACSVEEE